MARQAYREGSLAAARRLLSLLLPGNGDDPQLLHLLGLVEARSGDRAKARLLLARAAERAPERSAIIVDYARLLREEGAFAQAEALLEKALRQRPNERPLLVALGLLKRDQDDRDRAAEIFDSIVCADPANAHALSARARIELERGRDARALHQTALALSPGDPQLLLGAAAAFYQQNEVETAIDLLSSALAVRPDWLDGLQTLARMRWQSGDLDFAQGYQDALKLRPGNPRLWLALFRTLASTLGFESALERLGAARAAAGQSILFDMFEAEALSETGIMEAARAMFDRLGSVPDPCFAPAYMRFLLRSGKIEQAARCGEHYARTQAAALIWPYLGTAWRLLADPRWQWLERYEECVAILDLDPLRPLLPELAQVLRALHRDTRHPFNQSPRGGTQTDGALLQRSESCIAALRAVLAAAVEAYVDRLPPPERDHPFLGAPRSPLRFAGSWSIKLKDGGYHVSHVHPQGWLSSALYIALPADSGAGSHSGWLALGAPPEELGLGLQPVRMIEPAQGRLVLFPSILWHGTVPFDAGERLTVAFDVAPRG